MKPTNLISLISAFKKLNDIVFQKYLATYQIKIKNNELNDLQELLSYLKVCGCHYENYEGFYVGYDIPQIGKEFDLLKIGESAVLNIELKYQADIFKVKNQLLKNKYYLKFLNRETEIYTFIASTKKLYKLNSNDELIETNSRDLCLSFLKIVSADFSDIDDLFTPSKFLVSPLNSPDVFINEEYFLNTQQFEYKNKILADISKNVSTFIGITGEAGTGKTLLAYDIALTVNKLYKVLVVHCGVLNEGHNTLNYQFGWDIIPIKELSSSKINKFDVVIIDEAQRMKQEQLDLLTQISKSQIKRVIFSYDYRQTLSLSELRQKVYTEIDRICDSKYNLNNKVRANKELISFINRLFYKERVLEKLNYKNIKIVYHNDVEDARECLYNLSLSNHKLINLTPSRFDIYPYDAYAINNNTITAHSVIGQEFDNIVAIIDENYYYKNNILSTKNYKKKPIYHPTKMLYQIVSRAKLSLTIVVLNNEDVLERCLNILNYNK